MGVLGVFACAGANKLGHLELWPQTDLSNRAPTDKRTNTGWGISAALAWASRLNAPTPLGRPLVKALALLGAELSKLFIDAK
eukprot:5272234-Alexandrium_andersonii.AAC.1